MKFKLCALVIANLALSSAANAQVAQPLLPPNYIDMVNNCLPKLNEVMFVPAFHKSKLRRTPKTRPVT